MRTIERVETKRYPAQLQVRMYIEDECVFAYNVETDNIEAHLYDGVEDIAALELEEIKERMYNEGLVFLNDNLQEDQLFSDIANSYNPHIWDVEA